MADVVIHFGNKAAAKHFMSWLDGQGEQDYWTWMECREGEESGDITAVNFKYGDNLEIEAVCGRLDAK